MAAREDVVASRWPLALALALVASAAFAVRLNHPGFFDNEGRYAEVARVMVTGGDLVTMPWWSAR